MKTEYQVYTEISEEPIYVSCEGAAFIFNIEEIANLYGAEYFFSIQQRKNLLN